MSADAQTPAPSQAAQASPKRLSGLWIICVLSGLTGMLCVSLMFVATPMGEVVLGVLAVAQFAAGVGLWRRWRTAWRGAVTLSGLYALGSAVMGAGGLVGIATAIAVVVPSLAVLVYLLARRDCFGASARPPGLRTVGAAAALLVVLLIGGAWLFVTGPDEALRSFDFGQAPRPEVESPANAYPILRGALAELRPEDGGLVDALLSEWRENEGSVSDAWRTKAAALLEANRGALERLSQATERPYIAPPLMGSTADLASLVWLNDTRFIARLSCLEAEFEMARGDRDRAVTAALRTVRFGVVLSRYPNSLIQWLVGSAVVSIGLASVRELAAAPPAGSQEPWRRAIEGLQLDDKLKEGFRAGLAAELRFMATSVREMASGPESPPPEGGSGRAGDGPRHRSGLARALLVRSHPLLKPNMMANQMGEYFADFARSLDEHPGPATDTRRGPFGFPRDGKTGLLQWARDPMGSAAVELIRPAIRRARDECMRSIGSARMTQVLLALRCYQLEHGKLPEALDELAPEYLKAIPADPFTRQPFGYQPGGEKPRIWSVGPDRGTDAPDAKYQDDVVVPLGFAGG